MQLRESVTQVGTHQGGRGRRASLAGTLALRLTRPAPAAAIALAAYLALAVGLFGSAWGGLGRAWIGLGKDSNLVSWFLAWVPYAISHGHNPLLTDWLNHPAGVNLMWNTSMPLAGVFLWPVTALGGPVAAYNVLLTASLALSAWTAFLAIRGLFGGGPGAFVGALVYGFSPYMLTQSQAHVHVVAAFLPPLMLLLLGDMLFRHRWPPLRSGFLLGMVCAAQLLIGEEVLVGAALMAAVGAGVLAVLGRDQLWLSLRQAVPGLLAGLGVMALLVGVPLGVQFLGPHHIYGDIQPHGVYVSDLLNFVLPTDAQAVSPAWALRVVQQFTGNGPEYNAYLGLPLTALLVVASLAFWRDRRVIWAAASAGLTALLSMGPHLHVGGRDTGLRLPELVIDHLPVLGNLQPNRLALFTDLFAGVVVALVVTRVLAAPAMWRVLGLLSLAVALVPLFPRLPFPTTETVIPAYFQGGVQADVPQGSVVLVAPFADFSDADAMAWQAASGMWFKSPAGYFVNDQADGTPIFGVRPTWLSATMVAIQSGWSSRPLDGWLRATIADELARQGVREVVVGPMARREAMLGFWHDLLGRRPDFSSEGVQVWRLSGP